MATDYKTNRIISEVQMLSENAKLPRATYLKKDMWRDLQHMVKMNAEKDEMIEFLEHHNKTLENRNKIMAQNLKIFTNDSKTVQDVT